MSIFCHAAELQDVTETEWSNLRLPLRLLEEIQKDIANGLPECRSPVVTQSMNVMPGPRYESTSIIPDEIRPIPPHHDPRIVTDRESRERRLMTVGLISFIMAILNPYLIRFIYLLFHFRLIDSFLRLVFQLDALKMKCNLSFISKTHEFTLLPLTQRFHFSELSKRTGLIHFLLYANWMLKNGIHSDYPNA